MIKIQDFIAQYEAIKQKLIAISKLPHSHPFGDVFYVDKDGYVYVDTGQYGDKPEICYTTEYYSCGEAERACFRVPVEIIDQPLEYFEQLFREKHEEHTKANLAYLKQTIEATRRQEIEIALQTLKRYGVAVDTTNS